MLYAFSDIFHFGEELQWMWASLLRPSEGLDR